MRSFPSGPTEKKAEKGWIRISIAGSWSNGFGFTLMELMVVLIILSVAVAMVGPRFSSGLFADEFKSSLRRLQAGVVTARNNAMLTGATHELVFEVRPRGSDSRTCFFIQKPPEEDVGAVPWQEGQAPDFCFNPKVEVTGVSKQGTEAVTTGLVRIRFLANGLAEPALFYFQFEGRKHKVAIKPFNSRLEVVEEENSESHS